ncbi:MAG: helix-turn-helix transcriptional regulator [Solobacterium sp.]|nr:helix-turn-helix transcriptional regulator [Solobacterium sp.]
MCKTYAEVAMEVIREDWELRKEQNNPVFNQERIAQMMGISRSQLAKALTTDKNPTISFICSYATAVGRPMDELLYTIGRREVEEQRSFLISNQMTARAATENY